MGVLLASLGGVIVSIINALKTQRVEGKVDTVHELTNSRLSRIEGELMATRNELATALQVGAQAENARVTLASEASAAVKEAHDVARSAQQLSPSASAPDGASSGQLTVTIPEQVVPVKESPPPPSRIMRP